jgi:hypothetical protein
MVASIAQKVLGSVLGKYIDGFDKNNINVGILSGAFQIENVALKKEISNMFNLPFNLKFNHIGKIKAKIPWRNLSNSPVEVELEDIMVIAEPKSKEDLLQIAVNIYKDREKMLEDFASNLEEKFKKGGKEESAGYFSGLITKVIDNVQISVRNIHIRFECQLGPKQSFNFGLTLDSLSIYTTDDRGNKLFLDRSKAENSKLPVNKKLMLNDFSFYWNDKDMAPFSDIKIKKDKDGRLIDVPIAPEEKAKIINKMRNTIASGMGPTKAARNNDFQYLLNLSIEAKMIQYTKTQELINQRIPEIQLFFDLEKLSSVLSKGQFGQIIGLLDYFSDYLALAQKEQEKLRFKYLRPLKTIARAKGDSKEKKKEVIRSWWKFAYRCIKKEKQESQGFFTVLRIGKNQKLEYAEKFKQLYSKVDYNSGKPALEYLTEDEREVFQVIVLSLDVPTLKKCIEDLLKEKERLRKKESKKGWFSFGKQNLELTPEEEKEINDLMKEVIQLEENKFKEPDDFQWLKLKFVQKECSISLQRQNAQKQLDSVDALFTNFEVFLMLRKNGLDVDIKLQNFEVTKKTEISKGNVIVDQIFRPLIETHNENKLVNLELSTNPVGYARHQGDKELKVDTLLQLSIKSSEIIYNAKMIATLVDVFDTSAQMEALKKAATEQAEMYSEESQKKLNDILKSQKTLIVDISIAAPLIVLPFNQDELITSECWVLSPGILKVIGDNFSAEDRPNRQGYEHYDNFMIGLENIRIEYLPSMLDYMQTYTPDQLKNTKNKMIANLYENKSALVKDGKIASYPRFDLLKNFNITLDLNMLKSAYLQLNFEEPRFKVGAVITKLQIDLNQKIYADLLRFGDIFKESGGGGTQLQTEKRGILASNSKYGPIIRGNPYTGFSTYTEYAILSQGRLYFFKDSKAQAAYDYYSLKDTKCKVLTVEESGHPYGINVIGKNKSNLWLAFENDQNRTSWVVAIENEVRKLRVQAAPVIAEREALKAEANIDIDSPDKKADDSKKNSVNKKPGDDKKTEEVKNPHLAAVTLNMEELQMRVFDVTTQMFDFAISSLEVGVDQKDTETIVKVNLQKINILDTREQDKNLKTLVSSEIGRSIATEVKGMGINPEETSKTLMSVDVSLIDPKSTRYQNVDKDINIKFGSLFVNLRPNQIHRLMVFFIPKDEEQGPRESEILDKTPMNTQDQASPTPNNVAVVSRNKNLLKREDDKVINMRLKFSLEKISVIMINELKNVYLCHSSISNVSIEFITKVTGMALTGTLQNLQLHDLTNYPETLISSEFARIMPNELFGISQKEGSQSLIKLSFEKINSDVAELPESNISGYLGVTVDQIQVNFYMQVVMRILDFVTGHLLPALSPDEPEIAPSPANPKLVKQTTAQIQAATPHQHKVEPKDSLMLNNLKNPFWMKMAVDISQPIILLKCGPGFKEYLQVELGDIKIRNERILNSDRILINMADEINNKLGLGSKIEGIWTETYFISMRDMSIKKIVERDGKNYYQYFMHPFNFNLAVEMAQYESEYRHLLKASPDPADGYTDLTLKRRVLAFTNPSSPYKLVYDGGMGIRARISPMIMIFGNAEFNFIMKSLFHNITYNDYKDEYFVKDFKVKQEQQVKEKEEGSQGNGMTICIDIDYIALVTMETNNIEPERFEGDMVVETRRVYSKLFIKELRVDILMVSNGEMQIGCYIRRLVGSYLQDRDPEDKKMDLLEKGFIGKLSVFNEFKAENCNDLRNKVVKNLQDSISEKGESGSYGLKNYSQEGLMLNVHIEMHPDGTKDINVNVSTMRILAQTDVIMKLTGLAQMNPDCAPPEPLVDPDVKKALLDKQAKEKEKRLADIKEYFNRKVNRALDHSRSLSSVSDNKNKQKVSMRIIVEVKDVMFIIPTKEHKETLVTSGDLIIKLQMYEPSDMHEVWEIQQGMTRTKKHQDAIDSVNVGMSLNLSLLNFQIYYCDFVALLKNSWKKVPKRHILMPLKMMMNYFDFNPVTKINNELKYYSVKRIEGQGESLIFKLTLSDIDVLSRIAAFQMKLLEESAPPKTESPDPKKTITPEILEAVEQEISVASELALKEEKKAPAEHPLPNKMKINGFKFKGLQLFLINDDEKIFVPVLDFVISEIKLNMAQTPEEMQLDVNVGLGVEYYNPSVSKWEPFVEKSFFFVNMNTNSRNGINTTHIFVNLEQPDQNVESVFNVNLSVRALSVLMRSLDSFGKWNEKRAEEEKRIKEIRETASNRDGFFSHVINAEEIDVQENLQSSLMATNSPKMLPPSTGVGDKKEDLTQSITVDQQVEALLAEEEDKVDYISPYLIKNLTGYPITAEEYVNKTEFGEDIVKIDGQHRTSKKSRFRTERLGTIYNLTNEESLNLKLETGSKFKKNEGEQKLVLEEQPSDAKMMVTVQHDLYKMKPITDLPLDQRYSKRKRLEGDHKILNEFSLICDNFFDDSKKTLTISSPVLLENKTDIAVTFRILKRNNPLDILLPPESLKPVPFDLVACNYQILFENVTTDSKTLQKFTNKEDGYSERIQLGPSLFVLARVKRDPEIFQRIIIVLLPIIKLKNCLPFALDYNIQQPGKEDKANTMMPQTDVHTYSFDPDKPISLRIRVQGFEYSQPVILVDKQKDCDVEEIMLKDPQGYETSIKIARVSNSENLFTYYVYAAAVLINETPLEFEPVYTKDKSGESGKPVAGVKPLATPYEPFNKNVLILNNIESNIKLQLSQTFLDENFPGYKVSKQNEVLPLKAIDSIAYNCQIESKTNPSDKRMFELGIYLTPLFVDKQENIYTKTVQISPRNIFYNCTNHTVEIKQADTEAVQVVQPNTRAPYWWSSASKDKKLQVKIVDKNSKWSNRFDAKILGSIPMSIIGEDGKPMCFYYEVKIDSAVEFTYFKEMVPTDPYFAFRNESNIFHVTAWQKGTEAELQQEIPQDGEIPFAWIVPDGKDGKKVAVFKLTSPGNPDHLQEIDLSKVNTHERIKIGNQYVDIGVTLRKTTKLVTIRDIQNLRQEESKEKKQENLVPKNQMILDLSIGGLGVSLISPYENTRIEPLYIYFGGIEMLFSQTDFFTSIHFKLKYLHIDNNTTPLSPFPVFFTPSFKNKIQQADYYMLTFKMSKRNESKPEIQLYDELVLDIQPITIGLDDIALGIILDVVSTVQKTIAAKPHVRYQHKYFYINNDDTPFALTKAELNKYKESRVEWLIKEPNVSQTWIYVREFKLSVFELTVSFRTRAQKAKNQLLVFGTIFKSLGVAVLNIDEANIKIRGVRFEHVFETMDSLTNKLVQHYKDNGIKQGLKILGSIDILGNPVNLLSNIGTGVVDFFEKPIEGFAKGPLDVAKGLGQGTASLVKNTGKGVFNSASKATGALSSAFSALSMVGIT